MQTNQIKLNNESIEKASDLSIKYSKAAKLSDLKSEFVAMQSESPLFHSPPEASVMMFSSFDRKRKTAAFGAPLPTGASTSVFSLEPKVDEYSIAREDVSYAQTQRLVQKALNRKK